MIKFQFWDQGHTYHLLKNQFKFSVKHYLYSNYQRFRNLMEESPCDCTFDSLLFENRNKKYGAYSIRSSYLRYMLLAATITFITFLLVVLFPTLRQLFEKRQPQPVVNINEGRAWIISMLPQEEIPYSQQAPVSTPRSRVLPRLREMVVTDDAIKDTVKSKENLSDLIQKGEEEEIITSPLIDTSSFGISNPGEKTIIPVTVQALPKFNGGDYQITFRQWVTQNLKYPLTASDNKISGKLIIQFSVNKEGFIQDIVLLQGTHPLLDAETVRVISSSPPWEPAIRNGNTISVRLTMPITFSLSN